MLGLYFFDVCTSVRGLHQKKQLIGALILQLSHAYDLAFLTWHVLVVSRTWRTSTGFF